MVIYSVPVQFAFINLINGNIDLLLNDTDTINDINIAIPSKITSTGDIYSVYTR